MIPVFIALIFFIQSPIMPSSRVCTIATRPLSSQIKALILEIESYHALSCKAYHSHDMEACRYWDGMGSRAKDHLIVVQKAHIRALEKESLRLLEASVKEGGI